MLQLIANFGEFAPLADIKAGFRELAEAPALVDKLLEHDILIPEDGPLDRKEKLLTAWNWGHDARYFHFATRDVQYTFDADEVREHFEEKSRLCPPPSPFKDYGGPLIQLPTVQPLTGGVHEALVNRRTTREFAREPLRLGELSDLLFWTWGRSGSSIHRNSIAAC